MTAASLFWQRPGSQTGYWFVSSDNRVSITAVWLFEPRTLHHDSFTGPIESWWAHQEGRSEVSLWLGTKIWFLNLIFYSNQTWLIHWLGFISACWRFRGFSQLLPDVSVHSLQPPYPLIESPRPVDLRRLCPTQWIHNASMDAPPPPSWIKNLHVYVSIGCFCSATDRQRDWHRKEGDYTFTIKAHILYALCCFSIFFPKYFIFNLGTVLFRLKK